MRVGVVGLGNAGYRLHLPALAGIPGANVVGGCDPDSAMRDRARRQFGIPVFDDFGTLLSQTSPEVVIVGTPPDSHAEYCRRSLAAGAHVICEKPFLPSVDEADAVLAEARSAGRCVALNQEFREMPIFRAIRDALTRDSPDGPLFAQVWQLMYLPPGSEAGWRGQMTRRTLYEAGPHLVDLLMSLFGEKPRAVQAWTSPGDRSDGSDAVVVATLEFSRGRLAQLTQNRLCRGETQYVELRADTRDGSFRGSFGGRARLSAGLLRSSRPHVRIEYGLSGVSWRERGVARQVLARNPRNPEMMATRVVLDRTIEAFRVGTEPPTSGESGRDILEVVAACYRSAETGRRVELDRLDAPTRSLRMGTTSGKA
ncbi:MAG TPA: Gfo/Idh/MocA family oxidoreductase [Vicinamibacterales bacterium]|nr:Gfo/Idh/MocA family oxidoreductase [Vicinamibacterales bacterium]